MRYPGPERARRASRSGCGRHTFGNERGYVCTSCGAWALGRDAVVTEVAAGEDLHTLVIRTVLLHAVLNMTSGTGRAREPPSTGGLPRRGRVPRVGGARAPAETRQP